MSDEYEPSDWTPPPGRDRWIVGIVVVAVVLFAVGSVLLFGLR